MMEVVQTLPQWLIIGGLIYLAVLLTIAVLRGQEVQFFPPKIGARPPIEKPKVLHPDETSDIEGVWGDTFSVKGQEGEEVRAALLSVKRTDEGHFIQGREYDKNLEVLYDWNSVAATYEHGNLKYLFEAREKLPDGLTRNIKGYTFLEFFGLPDKPPTQYSGRFLDFWDEPGKICTRSGNVSGRRFADQETYLYDTDEGRSLAKKLLVDRKNSLIILLNPEKL